MNFFATTTTGQQANSPTTGTVQPVVSPNSAIVPQNNANPVQTPPKSDDKEKKPKKKPSKEIVGPYGKIEKKPSVRGAVKTSSDEKIKKTPSNDGLGYWLPAWGTTPSAVSPPIKKPEPAPAKKKKPEPLYYNLESLQGKLPPPPPKS